MWPINELTRTGSDPLVADGKFACGPPGLMPDLHCALGCAVGAEQGGAEKRSILTLEKEEQSPAAAAPLNDNQNAEILQPPSSRSLAWSQTKGRKTRNRFGCGRARVHVRVLFECGN